MKYAELLSPLPDLFSFENGERVRNVDDWKKRREELYRLAVGMQYGGMPPEPEFVEAELLYRGAKHVNFRIHTGPRSHPVTFLMRIHYGNDGSRTAPVVIDGDGAFLYPYTDDHRTRYCEANVIFVHFDRTELARDARDEVHTDGLYAAYPGALFSEIAAWAWGYHRCVDVLEQLDIGDRSLIAFTGHSRGGKTALLAGATDERCAVVAPNCSGCGGAGCYRYLMKASVDDGDDKVNERLGVMMNVLPCWLGKEMRPYADREGELPFDQHYLKALVAPRILLQTEALEDIWANTIGTYITHCAAKEAFRFLGVEDHILLHYREGGHTHSGEDVDVLLHVIESLRRGVALPKLSDELPYEGIVPLHTWSCPEPV